MGEETLKQPLDEKPVTHDDHATEPTGSDEDPRTPVVWLPPDEE
jgi:hypothetical protein